MKLGEEQAQECVDSMTAKADPLPPEVVVRMQLAIIQTGHVAFAVEARSDVSDEIANALLINALKSTEANILEKLARQGALVIRQ